MTVEWLTVEQIRRKFPDPRDQLSAVIEQDVLRNLMGLPPMDAKAGALRLSHSVRRVLQEAKP